jgi:hypothetical protein
MKLKRYRLYILLAFGIVLVISGFWLIHTLTYESTLEINIPAGKPVLSEELDYVMRGQFDYLFIWENGDVLYIEETGLRIPTKENPPSRIWKKGKLQPADLTALLEYLKGSSLDKLDTYYPFAGKPLEPIDGLPEGGFTTGDMGFSVSVDYGGLNKTVTAFGYLTPDNGETYPDMPYPLNEIYTKLRALSSSTQEVTREKIQ